MGDKFGVIDGEINEIGSTNGEGTLKCIGVL
jgi:hypothetical protein